MNQVIKIIATEVTEATEKISTGSWCMTRALDQISAVLKLPDFLCDLCVLCGKSIFS